MTRRNPSFELLRQIDNDLMVQYEELLCLRAQVARLRFPLKRLPPRRRRIPRRKGSSARVVHFNERPASPLATVLLLPEHHT
jgi:hypothetical protein